MQLIINSAFSFYEKKIKELIEIKSKDVNRNKSNCLLTILEKEAMKFLVAKDKKDSSKLSSWCLKFYAKKVNKTEDIAIIKAIAQDAVLYLSQYEVQYKKLKVLLSLTNPSSEINKIVSANIAKIEGTQKAKIVAKGSYLDSTTRRSAR